MAESTVLPVVPQTPALQTASQRFEMRMTKPLLDGLGLMAEKEALTRADVVRRALGLYAHALQAEAQGAMHRVCKPSSTQCRGCCAIN